MRAVEDYSLSSARTFRPIESRPAKTPSLKPTSDFVAHRRYSLKHPSTEPEIFGGALAQFLARMVQPIAGSWWGPDGWD